MAGVCLLSLVLMVSDSRVNLLQDIRRILAAAAYPLQVVIDSPAALGRWIGENASTRSTLLEENDRLRRSTLVQSARLQRMASLEAENARLRALLDSTAKVGDRVLIAEIMSVDMDPFRHRVVVNKGSRNEAYVGQALIDADGVVGQITRDQVFSSEALLITDLEHAVPVEILRTRQRTVAMGTGQLDRLSLPFLPRNTDIREGDLLVSSGLGGTFPPGYPVATVSTVEQDTGREFLTVDAEPAASLTRVREVLLIWPGSNQLPESEEPETAETPATAEDASQPEEAAQSTAETPAEDEPSLEAPPAEPEPAPDAPVADE